MIIGLSSGHNVFVNGIFDPGAIKYPYIEADITRETVRVLIPKLQAQGHTVVDVTPYNQKFVGSTGAAARKKHHELRCSRADEANVDILLDVHINSGGGTGCECWVYSSGSKSFPYATDICNNISKNLGIKNRGVKVNPEYWTVSLGKAPAIIIEGAFIDNVSDMQKLTPELYAMSIAQAFGKVEVEKDHWAQEHYDSLIKKGLVINHKRFDDKITRGEVFALLDRIVK